MQTLISRIHFCSIAIVMAAGAPQAGAAEYRSVLIRDVPHVQQKPDFCGEACAEMYLRRLGKPLDQDFVFDQSGLDPALARGCYTRDLKVSLERIGSVSNLDQQARTYHALMMAALTLFEDDDNEYLVWKWKPAAAA